MSLTYKGRDVVQAGNSADRAYATASLVSSSLIFTTIGNTTSSINLSNLSGSFTGSFTGTSSFALTSSHSTTLGASLANNSSGQLTLRNSNNSTISTTTVATSTSDTDFLTYSYTPVSSNSYLVIHYHLASYDFSGGTGNDSYFSRIKVDSSEITYSAQSTVNGNRSGVLFPLMGRYTNSSTAAKSIVVACRRNSADDSITIVNTATSMWLRITEIAR